MIELEPRRAQAEVSYPVSVSKGFANDSFSEPRRLRPHSMTDQIRCSDIEKCIITHCNLRDIIRLPKAHRFPRSHLMGNT